MGLFLTHDCWSSSYSYFSDFREELARAAGFPLLQEMSGYGGTTAWTTYLDDPIVVLLLHSDCDGDIPWRLCRGLAERLLELSSLLRGAYAGRARTFAAGLNRAFDAKEDVVFA